MGRVVFIGGIFLVVSLLAAFAAAPVASASHTIPFYCYYTSPIDDDYVFFNYRAWPPAAKYPADFVTWDMNGGDHPLGVTSDDHTDRLRTVKKVSGCVESHYVEVVGRLIAAEEGNWFATPFNPATCHARGYGEIFIIFPSNVLITSVDTDGGNAQIVSGGVGNVWVILRVDPENYVWPFYWTTAKDAHPVRVTADIPSSYWGSTIRTDFWMRYYSQSCGRFLFSGLNSEFTPA